METQKIIVDRAEAKELYRKYKTHQHYQQPMDWEIQRAYQLIAQGRVIINAVQSIISAGLNDEGLPKLAIVRADQPACFWRPSIAGGGEFRSDNSGYRHNEHYSRRLRIADGTWPDQQRDRWHYRAQAPIIPIHLRPKRALENYHVLFEAEWRPAPPVDPILLRRIGKSDLWTVCAAWELTPIEQAVLASRINA